MSAEEKEFEKFQNWIQQRFKISASVSWAKIILLYSTDERSGFEMFFKLWSEFRGEQQKEIFDRAENDAQNRIDPPSKHHRQEIDCIITAHQSDVG
ncbi:hypothetical protein [Oscillatoria sp. FACHB-1406]|uniref:hypothetical protein n=1 Tax=Oscillatoria sp. FACHB-1406 TaxID=2692846 RepID=UPI0016862737|nr:hypothetical protein [Oscillatoria sp. FACHB-1406]MBD2578074.1 hypothetical protein [Oscillatoria sp. FACHB-1406]